MQPEIDVSGLRGLHLMPEPSVWPLAIGWWIVLAVVVGSLILFGVLYVCWRKRPAVYACRKVRKIALDTKEDLLYLKQLSQLLKRVAIAADGRQVVALLSDVTWQEFLLKRVQGAFSEKEAYMIAFSPYEIQLSVSVDRKILTHHAITWIKKILKHKKSS